jgi:CBS domain containing-hemolysin-like protein
MMHELIYVLAIIGSVGGVAFFGGSEISFVSSNRFRIRGMTKRGVKGASTAQHLLESPKTLLSVTLVGTNIFVVLASSLATALLGRFLGSYSVLVSTVSVTAVILIFGEIIPKAVARAGPEAFLLRISWGLRTAYYVLYPVARLTSLVASLFLRVSSAERGTGVTRDEIKALVKEAAESGFGYAAHTYAHRVLDLSRMKVTGVMVPMDEVVCVDEGSTVTEAITAASRSGHSRYPVYKRTPDNIVGILHLKDVLGAPGESRIRTFVRSAHFVPETKSVKAAIGEMKSELRHMGVVADEYGRPLGIITFEDLVEEIMGEISDEYDQAEDKKVRVGQTVSGNTPIAVINEELDANIPDGAYDTVAGFMLDQAGAICCVGDFVEFGNLRFNVVEVKGKRIRRVRITSRED